MLCIMLGYRAAPVLGVLKLVLTDVLPNFFGQFGPGQRVRSDHGGQRLVRSHGFGQGAGRPAFGGIGLLKGILPFNDLGRGG